MSALNQKTIKQSISLNGVGLHTGEEANLVINPAEPNTGIVFKRTDLKENNVIIPNVFNVSSAAFCTTISNQNGVSVSTIEHLMGALYGMGVDNACIEIDNQEVPILDGSAKLFVEAISRVGLKVSEAPIKIIKIEKKIEFNDGKKTISFEPSKISLDIDFELKYENDLIGTQRNLIKVYESDLTNIYNSRTFCLFEDVKKLKEMGLAKGGALDNAIVVKDKEVLNKEGLRNEKEFVGKLVCSQGGHKLTNQLLRKVLSDNSNYSLFEIKEKNLPHTLLNRNLLKSIA